MAFSFINHFRRHPPILPCLYLCPYLLDAPLPRWSYTYAELLDFPSHFLATPLGSVSRQTYSYFFLRIDRHLLYSRISPLLLSIKSLSARQAIVLTRQRTCSTMNADGRTLQGFVGLTMSSSMSNLHTSKVGRLWESERTSILQKDGPEKGYLPLSCIFQFFAR